MRHRVFILSPADCGGARARLLLNARAPFPLAQRLRAPGGVALGEVFSFLSGLYFRGKLAYARAYACPPEGVPGILVITPNRGLLPAETCITLRGVRRFAEGDVDPLRPGFRVPLMRDARRLALRCGRQCQVILLGSVATDKYVAVLSEALGSRLAFPAEFVGRGDMSRGGLMLRCVDEGRELEYLALDGAVRHGARPPKLLPRRPAGRMDGDG